MTIKYFGHSCFEWTTQDGTKIVTDPFTKVGYELPKGIVADIVTLSHAHFDHNYLDGLGGYGEVLKNAGERILNGIRFIGIDTWHDPQEGKLRGKNVVFKATADGMTLCHLGDLGESCSQSLVDKIGKIDVLFLPIGGTYTLDHEQAFEYVERLAPKIVIPMHYRPKDGVLDIQDATPFLNLCEEKEVVYVAGETEITVEDLQKARKKIIYMERTDKI